MNGNVVRLSQQDGNSTGSATGGLDGGGPHVGITHEHAAEPETRDLPQQGVRRVSIAKDSESLSLHAVAGLVPMEVPLPFADHTVLVSDLADAAQQKRERVVRDLLEAVLVRHEGHPDTPARCRLHVHVVVPDAVA